MLTITILNPADFTGSRSRQVRDGTFSIGRGPENDWVLPDPERHLSKRHCVIAVRSGGWEVADLSTNGTFRNEEADPIGKGNRCSTSDGDRLRLGTYEIELRIAEESLALPVEEPVAVETFGVGVQPDHTPSVEDAFRPPQPVVLLDEDWDLDVSPAPVDVPPAPPAVLTPAALPQDDQGLVAAFLRGAGLPDVHPADPVATMETLGAAFRAMVGGLREALIARAAIKDEFRIAQTVVRARGNNPLKFSASADDAMLALVGVGRRTEMGAAEAIEEALRDMRLHELATIAAMQSAVRALLGEFSPAKLQSQACAGGLLPQHRKARAWDAFEAQHARLTQALSDDFESAFGRAFARAYEKAQREGSA
jgi:type VI secretion system protein ImpI/type VI secretion system protein